MLPTRRFALQTLAGQRMMLFHELAEPFLQHMGIDLRRRNIGVTQHSLDRAEIRAAREATQPVRARTGGSTFKNPPGHRAWELIDAAGCRGIRLGGAQVSEKHCNFLINTGGATAAELEALGEQVRARVLAHSGVALEWEIRRIGREAGSTGSPVQSTTSAAAPRVMVPRAPGRPSAPAGEPLDGDRERERCRRRAEEAARSRLRRRGLPRAVKKSIYKTTNISLVGITALCFAQRQAAEASQDHGTHV